MYTVHQCILSLFLSLAIVGTSPLPTTTVVAFIGHFGHVCSGGM